MRRTGIDLSSFKCDVVDAESTGRRSTGEPTAFHVHHFASIAHFDNTQTLTAELKALAARESFSRRAWVNLWDVRSSHEYLLLPMAPESELESRARHHGASVLGMSDADVTVSTTMGGTRAEAGHHPKRELSFFAAGSADFRALLRPIADAYFSSKRNDPVRAWGLARAAPLLPANAPHVALCASQSASNLRTVPSICRDLDGLCRQWPVRGHRTDCLRIAVDRLLSFLSTSTGADVSQVFSRDMPEVRSLTAPLIERLNIEVETLDTLESIDAGSLPEGFAERASTLRLASSIAVEPPPVNLLPVKVRASRTSRWSALRVVAVGTAAAVAFAALLHSRAC